jgi:hypothetical protein
MFGAYGGLTCFLTDDLSRDGIFECLRRRHHYGTTGCRMHMDVQVKLPVESTLYLRDPAAVDNPQTEQTSQVMMGDIVKTSAKSATLEFEVAAHAPIDRVEVRRGTEVIDCLRPFVQADLGSRIRVTWHGAEYRGRGRQTRWDGKAQFKGCKIRRLSKINAWNHERLLEQYGSDTVQFNAITTGNFGGFDVWLDESDDATLNLVTKHGQIDLELGSLAMADHRLDLGGLERRLQVARLPEDNPHQRMTGSVEIPLSSDADDPLWICVITEDGFQAWSSPVFAIA